MDFTAAEDAAALASTFTVFAEENFLLTLTNRGIYNRSRKDYENLPLGFQGRWGAVNAVERFTRELGILKTLDI